MKVIAFDTETLPFSAGRMAPQLVCITWQRPGEDPQIIHVKNPGAYSLVVNWLTGDDLLVGHHVVYDLAVLCAQWPDLVPLVFAKYDRDQITCTKIRQQLLDIAAGEFRGKFVTKKVADIEGIKKVKAGFWKKHEYTLDALIYRCAGRRLEK
jgi:hypothetical protein